MSAGGRIGDGPPHGGAGVGLAFSIRDCEGHFPERPLVPGVVLLARAAAALAVAGSGAAIRGIAQARLRQPVAPDDTLTMHVRPAPEGVRVDLKRGGTLVADAVFETVVTLAPEAERPVGAGAAEPHRRRASAGKPYAPDFDALLPHRPPMRWLRRVLSESGEAIECEASIPATASLAVGGVVPVIAALEAAAQSAALWEALRRSRESAVATPRLGYLVSLRDVRWSVAEIEVDRSFTVSATLTASIGALTQYAIRASRDGVSLLAGTIGTMLVG